MPAAHIMTVTTANSESTLLRIADAASWWVLVNGFGLCMGGSDLSGFQLYS